MSRVVALFAICYLRVIMWWLGRKEKKAHLKTTHIPAIPRVDYSGKTIPPKVADAAFLIFLFCAILTIGLAAIALVHQL